MSRQCDCGATTEGKWAGKHTADCASLPERGCLDLAEWFLETTNIPHDHQERIVTLAEVIENAVIKWMADNPPAGVCFVAGRTATSAL